MACYFFFDAFFEPFFEPPFFLEAM
jgi:hypothetical protein